MVAWGWPGAALGWPRGGLGLPWVAQGWPGVVWNDFTIQELAGVGWLGWLNLKINHSIKKLTH